MDPLHVSPDAAIGAAQTVINLVGVLIVAGGVAWSAWRGLRARDPDLWRRALAGALLWALLLMLGATLLRTAELRTWRAVGLFASVLALRTLIKRVLQWELRVVALHGGRPARLKAASLHPRRLDPSSSPRSLALRSRPAPVATRP